MTRAAYTGHEVLTFSDYIDLETGKTLHAEPGRSYNVAPASGRVVPEMPEPWFTAVKPTELPPAPLGALEPGPAEGESDPETVPDADPAPEGEHGTEEG